MSVSQAVTVVIRHSHSEPGCWCNSDVSPTIKATAEVILDSAVASRSIPTMRRAFLVVLTLAIVVLVWAGWGFGREFLAVDSCLDNSGSFNYAAMTCDQVQNHPYIPYSQRHPATFPIAVVAGIVAVAALVGTSLSTRRNTVIRDC